MLFCKNIILSQSKNLRRKSGFRLKNARKINFKRHKNAMKTQNRSSYLFAHKMRYVGWVLVGISLIMLIIGLNPFKVFGEDFDLTQDIIPCFAIYTDGLSTFFDSSVNTSHWFTVIKTSLVFTYMPVIFLLGCLFVCFSKEKQEDEMICKIREQSLVWATMVTFFIMIFVILFFYGFTYLFIKRGVIDLYLVIFYAKFRYELHKINNCQTK